MKEYLSIFGLLNQSERKRVVLLLICSVSLSVVDVIGMSSILPFLSVVASPDLIEKSSALSYAYRLSGAASVVEFAQILGLAALAVVILGNVLAFSMQSAITWYSFDLGRLLSARLFSGYLTRSYEFFLSRNSFNLMLNATGEVEGFVNGVLLPGLQVIARATTAAILVVLVVAYDPAKAGLFLVIVGGSYAAFFMISRRFVSRFGELSHKANNLRYRKAKEAFGAVKELRILGREDCYAEEFFLQNRLYGSNLAAHSIIAVVPRYVLEMTGIAALLITFLMYASSSQNIAATVPTLALYAIAGYRLMPAFQTIYGNLTVIRFNLPSLKALIAEFSLVPAHFSHIAPAPGSAQDIREGVKFVQVTCKYENADAPALREVSLTIAAHKTTGIVGASGAGKSTFLDVLTGLLPVAEGKILIDNVALNAGNVAQWRRSIGYVAQNIYLSDDTIRRNIAFGLPDSEIDDKLVEKAARTAAIHDFVVRELPEGYETVVGENGARLSGGQRQRLGIARALYRDPPILVFDEATSALDGITETAVIEAIRELSSSKTIIIIAHRLVTVQACDAIYLLDKGRVVDQGTYEALLQRSSLFRQMAGVLGQR